VTGRHVVAFGGFPSDTRLTDFMLSLPGSRRPHVCFLATASGDSTFQIAGFYERFARRSEASHLELFDVPPADLRSFLLANDVIYVAGGNTANMLAVWRVHGVDEILREAWERGVVLAGWSAGAICWFEAGVTDSFGPLAPLHDGLGLLEGSACPHYDGEVERRPTYHRLVAEEGFPPGIAIEDAAAVRFEGRELAEVVSAGGKAYRVEPSDGGVAESELPSRSL
jgi:dipeptidase E